MASDKIVDDLFSSSNGLPLESLREFLMDETYEWLEDADEKERAWLKIQRSLQAFQQQQAGSTASVSPSEPCQPRVCAWTSSRLNPDGYGGIDEVPQGEGSVSPAVPSVTSHDGLECSDLSPKESGSVTVKYILSDNWQGFGNQVWAASRHLGNMLADPERCRLLLSTDSQPTSPVDPDHTSHPLQGLWFCELGAGAGIPSWTALRMGARVVTLDQAIAGRIRVVAECAARNWHEVQSQAHQEEQDSENSTKRPYYRPVVSPHDWGAPVDELIQFLGASDGGSQEALQQTEPPATHPLFDVVVATECLFMPWFYADLLDSIESLLSKRGVAILTSALHGNVADEEVWSFLDLAQERGFVVDRPVPPTQLTPQKADMKLSQALEHTIRLSWPTHVVS